MGTRNLPRNNPWLPVAFLGFFALTRAGIAWLGIAPDPRIVLNHWQHADLKYLAADYWGTLWAFHAQPPLWNAIIGAAVKLAGNDAEAVTRVLHGLNMGLSAIAGLAVIAILRRMGLGPWPAVLLALLALCQPSVIYYENYIFYPHLTAVLVTLWLLAVTRLRRGGVGAYTAALGCLVALSWIWAIFHPVFLVLAGIAALVGVGIDRRSLAVLGVAVLMGTLPTLKNAVTVGFPTASTWVGLNVAQTAPGRSKAFREHCGFVEAHREIYFAPPIARPDLHPSLTDKVKSSGFENMNHIGLVDRSRECLAAARALIADDPIAWARGRWREALRAHETLPYRYFFDPVGWQVMAPLEALQDRTGAVGRTLILGFYAGLVLWCGARAASGGRVHALIFLMIGYFTAASVLGNGGEQERMRYTIEPLYLWLLADAALAIAGLFRRHRTDEVERQTQ